MNEADSLLRSQARAFRPDPQAVVRRTTPLLLLSVIGAVLFVLLIILLLSTRYKETQSVRGALESRGPTQKVTAPGSGRIVHWHVREGDRVLKGQRLVTISQALYDEEGNEISALLVNELEDKRGLVVKEIALLRERFDDDRRKLDRALDEDTRILKLLEQEYLLSDEQLTIGKRQLLALQTLMKNSDATSRLELDRQRATILDLRRQLFVAERRFQQEQARVTELQQQRESLTLQNELAMLPLHKQLIDLDQRISQTKRSDNYVLVAEQTGKITAIALAEGQPVRSNELLARIGNEANELEAVIYVPSRIAGKLTPGQEILLSFDAFDFHRYGRYTARIVHISEASLDPREALLPVPGLQEPGFRLVANLEQDHVSGPQVYPLQAGLLFTADFVLEELPLLYFIFKPVLELRGHIG